MREAFSKPEFGAAISKGLTGTKRPNARGHKTSEATKEKLRIINTGKRHSEEAIRKMSETKKGCVHTPEARAKQIESSPQRRPIRCVETGAAFLSCGRAAVSLGKPASWGSHIAKAAKSGRVAIGLHWEFA